MLPQELLALLKDPVMDDVFNIAILSTATGDRRNKMTEINILRKTAKLTSQEELSNNSGTNSDDI